MVKADSALWFVKFAITFALLLTCCWAAPRIFKNLPQFPPTTTDEQQVVVFERYFQLPLQDIVLVGSSLSYRLKEQYFERGNIRNAALPGGSPLTGLAIIEAAPDPCPQVIAVETNILNRGIDNALLQKFRDTARPRDTLRPLRTLAAYYQSARDDVLIFDTARRRSILERPVASYDTGRSIANALVEWNRSTYGEAILKDAKTLRSLVEKMEGRGVTIFFYEVPYPPVLDQTGFATLTRKTLDQVFGPANDRWLKLEYPADELRWNDDGAHLDERSALIIGSALADAISKKITAIRK
jgi:hypothetical protein